MKPPNPDSGLRRVLLARTPLKTKLTALKAMQAPSERFLVGLMRNPDTHPKIRLSVALKLAALLQQRAEAKKRKQVDAILQQETERLQQRSGKESNR